MRLARGALPWLSASLVLATLLAVAAALLGLVWLWVLAAAAALVFLFLLQFFRDPERAVADGVVSPADGKVVRVDEVDDEDLGRAQRLSIFMSPKDVHVNRFPIDATVVSVAHIAGGHMPAFNKDSHRNERVETLLDTALGRVKVIQIAGTVARRIVPYVEGGETVRRGDRLGLIRLGSRCDLLVPPGSVAWSVQPGQQVYGCMTSVGQPTPRKAPKARTAARSAAKAKGRGKAAKP